MPSHYVARLFLLLISAVVLLTTGACRQDDGGLIRINPQSFSAADEATIGARLIMERWRDENINVIEAESGAFTDGAYLYLRPLIKQLVDQPGVTRRDSFDWNIHLVLDDQAHAYTLPGGQLVMHTGLLHQLRNEAEFVGICAREVALAEQGAAMAALDRQVEDNVTLGDMILGNVVPLDHIIEQLPLLNYTEAELAEADSLAARLVCPSDYEERGLTQAVGQLSDSSRYVVARPANRHWLNTFNTRVSECPGADSLYTARYKEMLGLYVPH